MFATFKQPKLVTFNFIWCRLRKLGDYKKTTSYILRTINRPQKDSKVNLWSNKFNRNDSVGVVLILLTLRNLLLSSMEFEKISNLLFLLPITSWRIILQRSMITQNWIEFQKLVSLLYLSERTIYIFCYALTLRINMWSLNNPNFSKLNKNSLKRIYFKDDFKKKLSN